MIAVALVAAIVASACGATTSPTSPPPATASLAAPTAAAAEKPIAAGPATSPSPAAALLATLPPTPVAAPSGPSLLVDDSRAANSELVDTQLQVPAGFSGIGAHTVRLPRGFSISVVAAGLARARFMAFDAGGNLLVGANSGNVYRLPGANGSVAPSAAPGPPLLGGLNAPSNVALRDGYLYVGETSQITRYRYSITGPPTERQVVVPSLPTGGHSTRTIAFGPDGKMYVGIGSSCNICSESDERRAAVVRYNPDGSGYERFAWGLRNAVGLAFQPGAGLLWATVNERDNQGNEIPPDLVTVVRSGQNFGWPNCQPPAARPQQAGADCSGITPPTVGIQAHSAPLGMTFYSAGAFPEDYRDDILVAQHGSWNRQPPAEPKLLRIDMEDGRPIGVADFATGWQEPSGARWGRPVGLIPAPNGSLIVSDDQAGVIYQVSYVGSR